MECGFDGSQLVRCGFASGCRLHCHALGHSACHETTGGWLHFDVSGAMTTMNGTVTVVIMGSTNAGHMLVDVNPVNLHHRINRSCCSTIHWLIQSASPVPQLLMQILGFNSVVYCWMRMETP